MPNHFDRPIQSDRNRSGYGHTQLTPGHFERSPRIRSVGQMLVRLGLIFIATAVVLTVATLVVVVISTPRP